MTAFRPFLVVLFCLGLCCALGALPAVSPLVMGDPVVSVVSRASFLHAMNPTIDLGMALNYSLLYDEEGRLEGVNPDLAFAQMLVETSFLRFGGKVTGKQNNFAGLGALDGGDQGLVFSSPRAGIRAQIQHLKYYATELPLNGPPINPRLNFVKRGSAPTVYQLSKAWASDPDYGNKLMAMMARMVAHAEQQSEGTTRGPLPQVASSGVSGD